MESGEEVETLGNAQPLFFFATANGKTNLLEALDTLCELVVRAALATLTSNIRQNQLLLFYAQQNNDPVAKLAYEWFAKDLVLVSLYPDRDYQYGLFKALEDPKFKVRYLLLLQAADFNISDIEVRENERVLPGYQALPNELHEPRKYKFYDVYVTHQGKGGPFTIGLGGESTGTQIFMVLVLYLIE